MATAASKYNSRTSEEMRGLLDHQKQIKTWLSEVNAKIFSLEEQYLEETPIGNIIRGWDIDGKPIPLKTKEVEKERLFSYSSYQVWFDRKIANENEVHTTTGEKRNRESMGSSGTAHKSKKSKKSSSSNGRTKDDFFDDLDSCEDY